VVLSMVLPLEKSSSNPGTGPVPQGYFAGPGAGHTTPGAGIVPHELPLAASGTHAAGAGPTGGATHNTFGIPPHPTAVHCPLTVPEPPGGWPGKRYEPHATVTTRAASRSVFLI